MAKNNKDKEVAVDVSPAVAFEEWYAQREKAIPAQHHREILRADFKGQGLKEGMATIADFDKALKRYGVTLG
jgi:hypothetical protein